jgi:hypothetical protein
MGVWSCVVTSHVPMRATVSDPKRITSVVVNLIVLSCSRPAFQCAAMACWPFSDTLCVAFLERSHELVRYGLDLGLDNYGTGHLGTLPRGGCRTGILSRASPADKYGIR